MLAPYSLTTRSNRSAASGTLLGAGVDEREREPVLALEAPGDRELGRRVVDPDGPRAAARQPCGDVARAAPELDDVQPAHVGQRPDLALGHPPDAPVRLGGLPGPPAIGLVLGGLAVPGGAVADDVVGGLAHPP